ncbi:MAG TPA: single-stranded-DNA-specific exonuclease RecJ, partial [Cellvibrionaceae bacterium]
FDGDFFVVQQRLVGEKHLKLVLSQDANGQQTLDAIAFNIDTNLWPDNTLKKIRAAYRLDVNEFRGQQSVQLMVEYLEPVVDHS